MPAKFETSTAPELGVMKLAAGMLFGGRQVWVAGRAPGGPWRYVPKEGRIVALAASGGSECGAVVKIRLERPETGQYALEASVEEVHFSLESALAACHAKAEAAAAAIIRETKAACQGLPPEDGAGADS